MSLSFLSLMPFALCANYGCAESPAKMPSLGGQAGSSPTETEGDERQVVADGRVPPNHPMLQTMGRMDRSDPAAPVGAWGALSFRLRFTGPELSLHLRDEMRDLGAEGKGNVYEYTIDGGAPTRLMAQNTERYLLAQNLPDGEHEVEVVRRTESKWGKSTFLGFGIKAGESVLAPKLRPLRRLEVFGDSISAGLANMNQGNYTNKTENGSAAFGPVLARKLEAEWHIEARGGGSFYHPSWLPMVPWWDRTLGPGPLQHQPEEDTPLWSFDEYQPDVMILALGTNDVSEMYPHIDEGAYLEKYQGFLKELRKNYPKAHVFCLAPFKPGAPWDEVRSYIRSSVEQSGDALIHAVDPVGAGGAEAWLTYPDDYVSGDEYHPNLEGHAKIAEKLEPIVRSALGW